MVGRRRTINTSHLTPSCSQGVSQAQTILWLKGFLCRRKLYTGEELNFPVQSTYSYRTQVYKNNNKKKRLKHALCSLHGLKMSVLSTSYTIERAQVLSGCKYIRYTERVAGAYQTKFLTLLRQPIKYLTGCHRQLH